MGMHCAAVCLFTRTLHMIIVYVLLMGGCCSGLKDVRVSVPTAIMRGQTATLHCHFDLEGDTLYSVKWYKGRREFYRFTPKEDPAMKIFPIYGLEVEQSKSNATQLTLRHVQLSLSGKYSCEVSADAPSFHTALVSGEMDVVETPRGRPVISGIRHRYRIDDVLHGNCSSSWSKPAANLTWFINGDPAPSSHIVTYPVTREADGEREMVYLGLRMQVRPEHFAGGRLKIRCSASIHDVYYQSTEKSVEEEKPRYMVHGTPNTVMAPPNLATEPPPLVYRYEHESDSPQDDRNYVPGTSGSESVTVAKTTWDLLPSSPLFLLFLLFTVR